MTAKKIITLALGLVLALWLIGPIGLGPPLPGLGPFFEPSTTVVVLIALALALVAALLLTPKRNETEATSGSRADGKTPEDVIRERYARGELDRTQFIVMLEDVQTGRTRRS
jgi:uncharacterized membrane protein